MSDKHWDALVGPARDALEDLLWAGDDMADRIKELEAENKRLKSMIADVIADTGDDPEIMAASRAEWAARALAAEAKLAKADGSEVIKAQQLFNYYAVEVVTYGATASRLTNLENAWINLLNLQIKIELEELKGDRDE
jgi:hypothetical protein